MKSLVSIWKELADELASWCCTSTHDDYKTVVARVEKEGVSFLTISLPMFGKAFEACLDKGSVDYADFLGFKSSKSRGPLPLFLGGFLSRIFDTASGDILPDVCIDSIFAIRQLTQVFGKIELKCTPTRVRSAFNAYVQTDRETQEAAGRISGVDLKDLTHAATLLFGDVCAHLDTNLYSGAHLIPKHGPGKTADRKSSNGRVKIDVWPERLNSVFNYVDYALPSPSSFYEEMDHMRFPDPGNELPVRVVQVPKTLKTPRIIALEPACMQYMQQAILEPLVELLEAKSIPGNTRDNLVSGMIGFRDQDPNRHLALIGSKTGSLATLDLSEASDRVSTVHVEALFANFPHLREAVFATRSSKAQVPGHGVIPLAKFASMGSALCFPMESMVFLAVVFLGIARGQDARLSRNFIQKYRGSVRVYGDDIIVPTDSVRSVIEALELFGFKVNSHKSFWTGKFRESCGGDFYDGQDVTPVRFRREFPRSRTDAERVVSLVAFRNLLYRRGLWKTTRYVDQLVGKVLPHYPAVDQSSPVLGRHCYSGYDIHYADDDLHIPLVKGYVVKSAPPEDILDDWPALLKFFLKRSDEPLPIGHLQHQGRPQSVNIKTAWKAPY